MPSSSSDSYDYEEKRKLAQAVDPDFVRAQSQLPKNGHAVNGGARDGGFQSSDSNLPASKRAKIYNEAQESTEFAQLYSLDVTPDSQKFIAKQLAKSLEKNLKEIPPSPTTAQTIQNDPKLGIKLFAASSSLVTESDLKSVGCTVRQQPHKRKLKSKSKKKRKEIEDGSTDSSESDTEKLKSVAVTAEWVLKQ